MILLGALCLIHYRYWLLVHSKVQNQTEVYLLPDTEDSFYLSNDRYPIRQILQLVRRLRLHGVNFLCTVSVRRTRDGLGQFRCQIHLNSGRIRSRRDWRRLLERQLLPWSFPRLMGLALAALFFSSPFLFSKLQI